MIADKNTWQIIICPTYSEIISEMISEKMTSEMISAINSEIISKIISKIVSEIALPSFRTIACQSLPVRGRPLMIWGGAEEIEKKHFRGPSPGKKNLEGLPPGKLYKGLPQGKKIWRGYHEEKINSFSNFPPGSPQIINGRTLNHLMNKKSNQCWPKS